MAFPFDLLDLFIPEIAHWMAGKSTSQKRRFRNAGVGLLLTGSSIAGFQYCFPSAASIVFSDVAWTYFLALMFVGCGAGLLVCLFLDKKMNQPEAGDQSRGSQ